MSKKQYNTNAWRRRFFVEADIVIRPPGNGVETEEDNGDEGGNDINNLSGNQSLAEVDVRIDYEDGHTFNTLDDVELEKEDQGSNSRDQESDSSDERISLVETEEKDNTKSSKRIRRPLSTVRKH